MDGLAAAAQAAARVERVRFTAGSAGPWRITAITAVAGETLPPAARLHVGADGASAHGGSWALCGVASNGRYVTRAEDTLLRSVQEPLGRPAARHAALIPLRKSEQWWQLAQDERRGLLEASQHIGIGLDFIPAVARRLLHSRDIGGPFDFLTWFEFAPSDAPAFDELLRRLRATEEWGFVDREVEVRLAL